MKDKIFIDTNILVYAYTTGDIKKHETIKIFFKTSKKHYLISTQVLNEFYVTLVKYKIEHDKIVIAISEIITLCEVKPVQLETVNTALIMKKRYGFSYWDSLIISAALENLCGLLYSEDMSDGQIIENKLQITNPF